MRRFFLLSAASVVSLAFAGESRPYMPDVFRPGEDVLFIGDSVTHGGRLGDMNHYLGHGYQAEIAMRYLAYRPNDGIQFANRGISGNTSSNLVARWNVDAIPYTSNAAGEAGAFAWERTSRTVVPDVLSILVGINDFHKSRVSVTDYEKNLRQMVETARAARSSMRIVLCEPFRLPVDPNDGFAAYQAAAARVAKDFDLTFVPFQKLFDDLLKEQPRVKYWFWDTAHPTYAAHMRMADFWLESVAK